ncbi:trifunctional hydroxymethylpyrimidine kinase/phosphomethylpyrimidine kinase/thiaminase [Marasmius sp. AFHP31]|nr:trifunctional hydroxymethylpyrimidine kinase/phosphomethylpyrimidine kinase/thiaminase [Marasmius sp. AFHP31]
MSRKAQPAVLTIAGSDCSGGAGIQADLKTFAAHGCYGTSVLTALTAQNTTGVQNVHPVPPSFVEEQIKSVLDDIDIRAFKTGMLLDVENARAVVRALKSRSRDGGPLPGLVCDPVCVSTSGHTLLHPDAVKVLIEELFPLAALVTPNKSEAELLLSHSGRNEEITSLEGMLHAADELLSLGPTAVLLKGGHVTATLADVEEFSSRHSNVQVVRDGLFGENMEILQIGRSLSKSDQRVVVDVLTNKKGETTVFARPHISTTSTHGTGCTLSAAIASGLAQGLDLKQAVRKATVYTHRGIEDAPGIGRGNGPLNHLHGLRTSCIPAKSLDNPYPLTRMLIESSIGAWKHFVEHEFVKLLGEGILPNECFAYFIKQDYIYLKYYARAHGLLAAKSTGYPQIASATQVILNILTELETHKSMSAKFGISVEDLDNAEEGIATTGYGGYLLTIGLEGMRAGFSHFETEVGRDSPGDSTKLLMAVLACLLGYGEVGLWLKRQAGEPGSKIQLEGNQYRTWIEDYSGEMYQNAVRVGLETIEEHAEKDPPSLARLEDWLNVWKRCTELEKGFWDAAMKLGF